VIGGGEAAEGDPVEHGGARLGIGEKRRPRWRLDRAGSDRVTRIPWAAHSMASIRVMWLMAALEML